MDAAVLEVDDRLREEHEPLLRQRGADPVHPLQPRLRRGLRLCLIERGPPAAGVLGVVHGEIGGHECVVGGREPAVQHGHADAGTDPATVLHAVHGVHEPLGGGVRALAVGAGQQHGELVAADAGDDVVRAQRVPQRRARRADHLVADVVAERVVDRLEVVEVDQHHRAGRAVVDHRAELALEAAPVEQLGERVVVGLVAQLDLQPAPLGDVDHLGQQHAARVLVDQAREVHLRPARRAVGDEHPHLAADRGARRGERARDELARALAVGGVDEIDRRAPAQILLAEPGDRRQRRVHAPEAPVAEADRLPDRRRLERLRQPRVAHREAPPGAHRVLRDQRRSWSATGRGRRRAGRCGHPIPAVPRPRCRSTGRRTSAARASGRPAARPARRRGSRRWSPAARRRPPAHAGRASKTMRWLNVPATKPRSRPPVRTGEKMIVPRSPLRASATEPVAASEPARSARSIVSRRPGSLSTSTPSRLRPRLREPRVRDDDVAVPVPGGPHRAVGRELADRAAELAFERRALRLGQVAQVDQRAGLREPQHRLHERLELVRLDVVAGREEPGRARGPGPRARRSATRSALAAAKLAASSRTRSRLASIRSPPISSPSEHRTPTTTLTQSPRRYEIRHSVGKGPTYPRLTGYATGEYSRRANQRSTA